ncbi:MAG: reverse transcriptase domain-containing protein, partial [Plesiomonas shigelloides]
MTWDNQTISMRVLPRKPDPTLFALSLLLDAHEETPPDFLDNDDDSCSSDTEAQSNIPDSFATDSPIPPLKSTPLMSANNYREVDVRKHTATLTHLTSEQQSQLATVLEKYPTLWDDVFRAYPDMQVRLELSDNAVPHSSRGYPVPYAHRGLFKTELDRLVSLNILEPCPRSEWCAGTFIVPKKNGGVRWVTDFRGLNKHLKRQTYPIPRIQDLLENIGPYDWLSKLDLSMQFYTFELAEESRHLTTFATPFGLYRYVRCPMGVKTLPEIAQEAMEHIVRDLPRTIAYFDDTISPSSGSFTAHLANLDLLLSRLAAKNFSINIDKCEFAIKETDFLGYWITPNGIKPWQKKIEAILQMQPPKTFKQLKSFLGLVGFYRTLFPRKAHILAPLTDLTGCKKFTWQPIHQAAFERMKAIASQDCLLAYPDHSKPFEIDSDSSDYQLGGVIKQ